MNSDFCLNIENLTKEFYSSSGYKIRLFENISFSVKENEFTSIVAPEGSGKSTFLKILSGIDKNYSGKIEKTDKKNILLIPDKPDSFQWLSVIENIKFFAPDKDENDIKKIIANVGLQGYENHYSHPSSTGFRFRVSLARAIALEPSVILIDDALKNINDDFTRRDILELLRRLNFIYDKITFVIALTNLTDAIFLGDKILLLGKHPSTVIAEIPNKLPKNRKTEIIFTEEFETIIKECKEKIIKYNNNLLFKITV